MKLLIVLALFGAAFAYPDEVQPIELGEAPAPEFIDFGVAYIPESVAKEVGLDGSVDEPTPVHFVNENGDIQSYVEEAPVDAAEAPVEDNPGIAPGELEAVQVVDIADLHPSPFMYEVHVDEPEIVEAPEGGDYLGKIYSDPTWR